MKGEIFIISIFYLCIITQSNNVPDHLLKSKKNLLNKQKSIFTNYNIPKFKKVDTNLNEESTIDYSSIQNDLIIFAQNDTDKNETDDQEKEREKKEEEERKKKEEEERKKKEQEEQKKEDDEEQKKKEDEERKKKEEEQKKKEQEEKEAKETRLLIIIGCVGGGIILILIIVIIVVAVKNKSAYSKLQNEVNKISFKDGDKKMTMMIKKIPLPKN